MRQVAAKKLVGAVPGFLEWLGHELPPWREPCPINLSRVRPQEPASGKTSFYFHPTGEPHGWDMEVNGTRERVLDSVLPHEITHTIFASYFRQKN
jgi:hypothetical protein